MIEFLLNVIQFSLIVMLLLFIAAVTVATISPNVIDSFMGPSERELNDIRTVNNATEYRDDFAH